MPEIDREAIKTSLKKMIVEGLHLDGVHPDSIGDDDPIFGDGLGLDSVDALEIMVIVEKEYGIKIDGQEIDPADFASMQNLAQFVERLIAEGATASSNGDQATEG